MEKEILEALQENNRLLQENNKLKQAQLEDKPKMLRIKEVAKILGVNPDKAGKLWDREDFPRNILGTQTGRTKSI